jgi:hypothetical protein
LIKTRPKIDSEILFIEINDTVTEIKIQNFLYTEGIECTDSFFIQYRERQGDSLLALFRIESILYKANITNFTTLTFYAANGARIIISRDTEILISLELHRNKQSLRLILPNEPFRQRWLKNITRIRVD